jgi:hypothetical protein
LLCLAEPLTRRCRQACERLEACLADAVPALEKSAEAAIPSDGRSRASAIPDEQRAAHHLGRLATPEGIVGLICTGILAVAIPVNVQAYAEAFAMSFNRPGVAIVEIAPFGAEYAVTDLDLIAALLAMSLMVFGSAYAVARERRWSVLGRGVIVLTLVLAIALQVAAAVDAGYKSATGLDSEAWPSAATRGATAVLTTTLETVGGYLSVHYFVIPLALALLWGLAAPVRAFREWRRGVATPPRIAAMSVRLPRGIRFGRWIDESLFDPCRRLDRAMATFLKLKKEDAR